MGVERAPCGLGALASSLDVNRDVQVWAFERFLVRSLGFGFAADVGRDVLERAYWSVAESLARECEVTLVDGEGDRGRFERVTRTLVLGEGFGRGQKGPARSVAAMFEVARVSGREALEEAADRGDMVALLRSAGVGGPVSRPAEFDSVRWHGRSRLVAGMAAKRVAERVGIRLRGAGGSARVVDRGRGGRESGGLALSGDRRREPGGVGRRGGDGAAGRPVGAVVNGRGGGMVG